MKGNVDNPRKVRLVQLAAGVVFTIPAGANGWIDTDVSGTTGTNTARVWFLTASLAAGGDSGARPTGSANDPRATINRTALLSCVSATGHMDLYRNAGGDSTYTLLGYLE